MRRPSLLLVLVSAVVAAFLVRHHAFVPMWLEGILEYEGRLLVMLGFTNGPTECWIHLGGHPLPLAMSPYIGPGWFYLYAPASYAWFSRLVHDPYFYRLTGIALYLVDAWLLFGAARVAYGARAAFVAAAGFLTIPNLLLLCLTEHQSLFFMQLFLLLAALLLARWAAGGRDLLLAAAAGALGLSALTRLETLFWFLPPLVLWLAVRAPTSVAARWRAVPGKRRAILLSAAAFVLALSPLIAYNAICPREGLLSFVRSAVLAPSVHGDQTPLARFGVRLRQALDNDLLCRWSLFELNVPNVLYAALFAASLVALALRRRLRCAAFPLISIAVILPLSIFTRGMLREEHLIFLQPLFLLTIVAAVSTLEAERRGALAASFAALLLAGNVATSALDWRHWRTIPKSRQSLFNHSDPAVLAGYLAAHHSADRIVFTNVGLRPFVEYMTNGRLQGEDIANWSAADDGNARYADDVRRILTERSRRRVFAAVSPEHDGVNALPRTKPLYDILRRAHVPFAVVSLSSPRNDRLYDIVTVEAGQGISIALRESGSIRIDRVAGVRADAAYGGHVVGSVNGSGFERGDTILIDGDPVATTYGNAGWMTFEAPPDRVNPTFQLSVARTRTGERSAATTVSWR